MRWFGLGKRQVQQDPGLGRVLVDDVRQRFGGHVQARFADQADAVVQVLQGDDGVAAAIAILREFTDAAYADLHAQTAELYRRTGRGFAADRGNYRQLGQAAGPELRWSLFALPGGLHPYVQVAAAVTVLGAQARQAVKATAPVPLLARVFEALDLTLAGWEFGGVGVDVDAAALAERLITTARDLRGAMGEPPSLPDPVRDLMRNNNTVNVYDPTTGNVVGGLNPGELMRESFLI
ncbi:hypothetical protein ACWKSP_13360 [Micromonosporaceae bacterium Da 78-11]